MDATQAPPFDFAEMTDQLTIKEARYQKKSLKKGLRKMRKIRKGLAEVIEVQQSDPQRATKKLKKLLKRVQKLSILLELVVHPEHAGC